jgi:hypothetical protein
MSELLMLEALMKATETDLPLSERLAKLLGRRTVKVKVIDGGRLGCLYPLLPPEIVEGDRETMGQRERAWMMTLPGPQRVRHRLEVENVKFHVIAIAALEPRLTYEEAERFGDDANDLYQAILRFSGLMPAAAPAPVEAVRDVVEVGA